MFKVVTPGQNSFKVGHSAGRNDQSWPPRVDIFKIGHIFGVPSDRTFLKLTTYPQGRKFSMLSIPRGWQISKLGLVLLSWCWANNHGFLHCCTVALLHVNNSQSWTFDSEYKRAADVGSKTNQLSPGLNFRGVQNCGSKLLKTAKVNKNTQCSFWFPLSAFYLFLCLQWHVF